MKKFILIKIIILLAINLAVSQEYYYWAGGKKHALELDSSRLYVSIDFKNKASLAHVLSIPEVKITNPERIKLSSKINKRSSLLPGRINDNSLYWSFIDQPINKSQVNFSEIFYIAPSFKVNGKQVSLTQYFYVKLHEEQDLKILIDLAVKHGIEIVGNSEFRPLWHILSCDKNSNGNSLQMANLFYETGYFASSQPDLIEDVNIYCVNDDFFNDQWHLLNTGQAGGTEGNDIGICETWDITTGCNDVVVAVLDQGLEFTHPDFNNFSPISFDTESGTQPSRLLGDHGVQVSGVIGAEADNTLGIAGVAPNIQLMDISNSLASTPASRTVRADGIDFAWQNGADVINNSWGSSVIYDVIDEAIQDATSLGRNGLGTIVVFATGNDGNNSIGYPSSNPLAISVGSIGRTESRSSFSNFGNGLDVVAPGENIRTTDDGGNYIIVSGTSVAAPQVAGVAALILSVNPDLTQQEVRNIIESTADKIGNYTYTQGAGEQAGLTWNNEMGYGRLNAQAAVEAALPTITGPSLLCYNRTGNYSIDNLPAGANITWNASANLSILNGQGTIDITVESGTSTGESWVEATLVFACGNVVLPRYTVWVGEQNQLVITGLENGITLGQTASIQIENSNGCTEIISTDSDVGINFYYVTPSYALIGTNSAAYAGQPAWVYIGTYANIDPLIEFYVNTPATANPPDVNLISITRVPNNYPYPPVNNWKKVVAYYYGSSSDVDYWEWSIDNSYYGHPDGITNTIFLPPDSNNVTVRVRACSNTDGCSAYKTQVIN